jgi:hypothetical protein
MGTIAGIAAIAAFIAGAVMLLPGGLGLIHARRTSPATELLSGHPAHTPDPGTPPVRANGRQPAGTAGTRPA